MPGGATGDVPRACRMMLAAHPVPGFAGIGRIRFMVRDRLLRMMGQRRAAPQRDAQPFLYFENVLRRHRQGDGGAVRRP
jgi:hypothetical protein